MTYEGKDLKLRTWIIDACSKPTYLTDTLNPFSGNCAKTVINDLQKILVSNTESEMMSFFKSVRSELIAINIKNNEDNDDPDDHIAKLQWPNETD